MLLCCLVSDFEMLIWPEVKETIVYTFQITSRDSKIYFKHCMTAFNWCCKVDTKVFCHVNPELNKLLFPWIKPSILNILKCLALMLLEFSKMSIIFCFSCRINSIIPVFQKLFLFWISIILFATYLSLRKSFLQFESIFILTCHIQRICVEFRNALSRKFIRASSRSVTIVIGSEILYLARNSRNAVIAHA
jgi:hypothetical protein